MAFELSILRPQDNANELVLAADGITNKTGLTKWKGRCGKNKLIRAAAA